MLMTHVILVKKSGWFDGAGVLRGDKHLRFLCIKSAVIGNCI